MAPPEPMQCSAPDCDFSTPAGVPDFPMMIQCLQFHVQTAHPPAAAQLAPAALPPLPKPVPPPRPAVDEGITEGDWQHFLEKWNRYKRSCLSTAQPTAVKDNLRYCCSEQLDKSVYNTGLADTCSEEELMAAMKELAVRKQNILVNVFQFQKMGQDPNETAGSFVARLKGQARVCNFQLPAGQSDYSEKMVTHQLISGLVDPTIQEQMLAQSSTNKDITLDSALQFIQAKEAGKQDSRHLLESQPGLYRISEFQKNKSQQLVR